MSKNYTINRATHLTGLLAARNPHYTLTQIYAKILGTVSRMPAEAGYRKHTEKIVNERMAIVASEPTREGLESKMKSGVCEELIIQAENELDLTRKMLNWKPWEPLVNEPPVNQWKWPV